jgi:hypothetical protein
MHRSRRYGELERPSLREPADPAVVQQLDCIGLAAVGAVGAIESLAPEATQPLTYSSRKWRIGAELGGSGLPIGALPPRLEIALREFSSHRRFSWQAGRDRCTHPDIMLLLCEPSTGPKCRYPVDEPASKRWLIAARPPEGCGAGGAPSGESRRLHRGRFHRARSPPKGLG